MNETRRKKPDQPIEAEWWPAGPPSPEPPKRFGDRVLERGLRLSEQATRVLDEIDAGENAVKVLAPKLRGLYERIAKDFSVNTNRRPIGR